VYISLLLPHKLDVFLQHINVAKADVSVVTSHELNCVLLSRQHSTAGDDGSDG